MTVVRSLEGIEKRLVFNSVHQAVSSFRLSYCTVVEINLRALIVENDDDFGKEDLRGVLLDDLAAEQVVVGRLNVFDDLGSTGVVTRTLRNIMNSKKSANSAWL